MDKFPHISDTQFPDVEGVDAYKYKNTFDYSKYDQTQMTIGVCSVPWDVGLIHVGNAQIGGLGNVVMFDSATARDEWLDGLEDSIVTQTKYRSYHDDGWIQLDIPYESVIQYNYLWCEYTRLPVPGGEGGKDRFFFFIREAEYLAPNTSKVRVLRDSWQTWIYDIAPGISSMQLERGHAPMSVTDADTYLSNPIAHTDYLLADDVTYGGAYVSRLGDGAVLNAGDLWAVIVSTGNPNGGWGSKAQDNWRTPSGSRLQDGQPSSYAIAIEPSELSIFLASCDAFVPQYLQTIQGVFFVAKSLVNVLSSFELVAGITAHTLAQASDELDIIELNKAAFGYDSRYAGLAKLYTYPYAYLEIYDDTGDVKQVRVEETSGNLSLKVTTQLAWPWIALDGHISGIGNGASAVTFRNVNAHTFQMDGAWYDHLKRWNIPTFAVMQSAATHNDYATHFDRIQRANDADVAKTNEDNSALMAQENADAAALTAYNNTLDSNDRAKKNADKNADTSHTIAYRDADTAYNRFGQERLLARDHMHLLTEGEYHPGYFGYIGAAAWENITKIGDDWDSDHLLSFQVTEASIHQTSMSSTLNGVGSAASTAIGGATAGLVAGPGGAGIGAVTGLVGSAISLATATASIPLAITTDEAIHKAQVKAGTDKNQHAIDYAQAMYKLQRNLEIDKYNADQAYLPGIATAAQTALHQNADDSQTNTKEIARDTKTTDDANALNTYNTSITNDQNTYDTTTANAQNTRNNVTTAIQNSVNQAALDTPNVYGVYGNGDTSETRPMGVWCNVVTQAADAIAQAGDYFLRFGYAVNRNWQFTGFNLMPKFTYWKCSDVWALPSGVPDAYMDEIRFFLLGGVTVWRRPEYIGHTSIYENV